jgi:hypothetical protein
MSLTITLSRHFQLLKTQNLIRESIPHRLGGGQSVAVTTLLKKRNPEGLANLSGFGLRVRIGLQPDASLLMGTEAFTSAPRWPAHALKRHSDGYCRNNYFCAIYGIDLPKSRWDSGGLLFC